MKRTVAAFWIVSGILIVGWMATSAAQQSNEAQKGLPQQEQFLYRVQPVRMEMLNTGPTKEEAPILIEHLDYLKKLASQGVVIHAGRTLNPDETASFGIVVFGADSERAAREIMNNDPAVKKGIMRAALFPYRVLTQSRSRVRILPASP